jgi:hypothetical protein
VMPSQKEPDPPVQQTTDQQTTDDGDAAICWICAEPVKYYSVSGCNHRTCHVCALRLRALYKRMDCTFCKVCFVQLVEFFHESRNRIRNYLLSIQRPPMRNTHHSTWNP